MSNIFSKRSNYFSRLKNDLEWKSQLCYLWWLCSVGNSVGYDYVEIYGAFLITCQSSTLIWIPKLKFPVPYTLYYAPLCIALMIKT